jgi:Spy/CpxP family protein refolding chaperone
MMFVKLFLVAYFILVAAAQSQSSSITKCGLPTFHEKLPDEAKKEVQEIWANYTEGQKCRRELKKQQAIIDSLDSATKEELFKEPEPFYKGPPRCGLPQYINDLPEDAQKQLKSIWTDYKDGIECEDMQNATKALIDALPESIRQKISDSENNKKEKKLLQTIPAFLKDADQETRKKFAALFRDRELDREAKRKAIRKLAESELTPEQLKQFNEFQAERDARRNRTASNRSKRAPQQLITTTEYNSTPKPEIRRGCGIPQFQIKLPLDMQEKLKAIWTDYVPGTPCKKERKATHALIKTLPEDIRKALRTNKANPIQSKP